MQKLRGLRLATRAISCARCARQPCAGPSIASQLSRTLRIRSKRKHSVLRHSPASALHTDVAWKAQQAKHGCAAGSTATLHRPAVTAPAGRTGLAHRALQRIVPHGVTAARPRHVSSSCASALPRCPPASPATLITAVCYNNGLLHRLPASVRSSTRSIDSLHPLARQIAASARSALAHCIATMGGRRRRLLRRFRGLNRTGWLYYYLSTTVIL